MRKFISIVMSLILAITIIPITNINVSASTSGSCGENVIWNFDVTEGTLTISGSGKMMNFNQSTTWDGNYSKIVNVVVENGITSIGKNAFSICESLINIYIPSSVAEINVDAFKYCDYLKNVYYEGTEQEWNNISVYSGNSVLSRDKIKFNQTSIHECYFGAWETTNEPTCVSAGSKIRKCSCGNDDTATIPATGVHNFEWNVSIEATCTTDGEEKQHCTVCNALGEKRKVNKSGHKTGEWEEETKPTCTEGGLKVKKCKTCGEVLESETIAPTGHNFGEWKTTLKETEEHNGAETRTCKSCKHTETKEIDNIQSSDDSDKSEINIGDANGDGKVAATDARIVLQVVAGLKESKDVIFSNADVNNDNQITAVDARLILRIVAGIK